MRQKRRKPDLQPESRRRSEKRRSRAGFGRQINADLTGPDVDFSDHEFASREFPSVDTGPHIDVQASQVTMAQVRERAVRLLVNREHGRKELEQKLLQRELPPDLIVSVLDQLAQEGLQCDARFAESYTRMRIARGYGSNKIRADLQGRRLEQSTIEAAIRDHGADWVEIASASLSRKFGDVTTPDTKTRAKMQRFLYQRGFMMEEIRAAMQACERSVF